MHNFFFNLIPFIESFFLYENYLLSKDMFINFLQTYCYNFHYFTSFFSVTINLLCLIIIPFFCFPLLILNQFKNIILPVNILNFNNLYQLNKKFLIKSIFINLIKNLLFNYLIKIIYKLKKCQH